MLTEHLNSDTIRFAQDLSGWREAIELVSEPLVQSGAIKRDYVDAMLESIAAGGTYIDLGYGVALAHSRPERGVIRTGLSALWVRPDVLLNDEPSHPISLFVCLAAGDANSHLAALAELGQLLSDDTARTALLAAQDSAEAMAVLQEGEQK